ncbi:cytochrome o ubiquinol oxidase subunit IV [Methylomarinum vadi]|uniref:cytochrome o ubiquinol oxidase subunit IV n=1 Tax=Methylomarinum vadi TaxID=438855 RepID=UPI0004DF91E9|nr:cytochrome o ubiquinol oxidase subunit IV [Methylomarinum vadi]
MNANPAQPSPKLTGYLTGFALALLLTILAFGLIEFAPLPRDAIITAIAMLAVCQIMVHLHFFLHLDSKPRLRLIAVLFTLLVIFIMVGGTLWIMHDLAVQMRLPPH